MDLIDSHAHIDFPQFAEDREAMLDRAREAGVNTLLAIGTGPGPEKLDAALPYAETHDWIYSSVGIHPHEAKEAAPGHFDQLARLAGHAKVIAWGEIGLDYFYDHSPREVQKEVFRRQMELAREAKLPIIIHCRPSNNSENAWDDTLDMLRSHWAPSGLPGILHCFTGEWKHAQAALDFGFYISFAGNVSFPKAENIRESAKQVPLDRMLIETDSPYLAPVPHRGKRNEPSFVVNTAEAIAELRGVTKEETGKQTSQNFYALFPQTV
jgi:TatD DNase family protein